MRTDKYKLATMTDKDGFYIPKSFFREKDPCPVKEIEELILEWEKSGNENVTCIAEQICGLFDDKIQNFMRKTRKLKRQKK